MTATAEPALVVVAHGTRSAPGHDAVAGVDAVARTMPMPVHVGYAASSEPRVGDVVARLQTAAARRVRGRVVTRHRRRRSLGSLGR